MPSVRVKTGGIWQAPVVNGKFRAKVGGVWRSPSAIRISAGGAWRDPGYVGAPQPPTGLSVAGWNFSVVHTQWNAPASGPGIAHYEAAIRDSNGNPIGGQPDRAVAGTITYNWSVGEDGLYRFYVRSVGISGLVSGWVGPLNVGIGHSEQGHNETRYATRNWYHQLNDGNWYMDAYDGSNPGGTVLWIPNEVRIKAFHYSVYANAGFTSQLSPGPGGAANRRIIPVFAGQQWDQAKNMGNPYQTVEYGFDNDGANNWWGLMAKGPGWTVSPTGTQRMRGEFGIEGIETYPYNVYVVDRAYKDNFYW